MIINTACQRQDLSQDMVEIPAHNRLTTLMMLQHQAQYVSSKYQVVSLLQKHGEHRDDKYYSSTMVQT